MTKPRILKIILILLCAAGLTMGLFNGNDESLPINPAECRLNAMIGFLFFLFVLPLAALFVKTAGRLLKIFLFVRSASAGGLSDGAWRFSSYLAAFVIFFGIGMAISAIRTDPVRFWQGTIYLAGGLGIIGGIHLARRIQGFDK